MFARAHQTTTWFRRRWALLVWVVIVAGMSEVWERATSAAAQLPPRPFWQVRAIEPADFGVPHPTGFAFSPAANAFLLFGPRPTDPTEPGKSNVTLVSLYEDTLGTVSLTPPIADPLNVAFDTKGNRLVALDAGGGALAAIPAGPTGLPDAASQHSARFDIRALGLKQPQGLAFDPGRGRLFVLDDAANQIIQLTPNSGGGFDLTANARSNPETRIDLSTLGNVKLRGIAYNPSNAHLYVLDVMQDRLYELTETGAVVGTLDLTEQHLRNPQALLFAPSVDRTDDPSIMDLFILDSGQSMEPGAASRNGQLVELSLQPLAGLPSGTTLLPSTLVKTVDTSKTAWNPSSPDPSGVDYLPMTGRLLIADSEVDEMPNYFTGKNVYDATTWGTLVSTCSTTNMNHSGFSNEPTGVGIDPIHNRIYFSDDDAKKIFEVSLGPDGIYCTADDTVTSVSIATDAEDVAYGNNTIFVAGGVDAEVYLFNLGPNGVLGGGDDGPITHWDTASLGFNDLEGIGYNWDSGTLFIVSTQSGDRYLGETTTSGTLLHAYDLSFMGSASNLRSDVAYAPSSQNPAVKNIYIVSRGVDNSTDPNENDGKWWEISLGTVPPTNTPTATATPSSTPTKTATATPSKTPTRTPRATATNTPTKTAKPTKTPTMTPTATATATPSQTPTSDPINHRIYLPVIQLKSTFQVIAQPYHSARGALALRTLREMQLFVTKHTGAAVLPFYEASRDPVLYSKSHSTEWLLLSINR